MAEVGAIDEPERQIRDPALDLECHIYGRAPVQADGRLAGHPLYFRARFSRWTFVLCTNADIDPSTLRVASEPGFFREGEFEGFELRGEYGSHTEAGYIPYAKAERLIRECALLYIAASGRRTGSG